MVKFAETMNLDFYERLNTNFITGISFPDNDYRKIVMDTTLDAGILPYNEKDFEEYRIISDFVMKNYKK